ncbi:extracellular solute-binding protein [Paenibacillus sp. J2TS4]|uniref:extracellular solute-binding protein n=1 Tax=Paenibacillus sp. J2TS4 TaxID=2807194 RepID=UPI001BCEBA6B|nr:extracellular solute-binding protein [Paenibacillus sp. J2TS4]
MKKSVSVAMSSVLALSMLAACSGGNKHQGGGNPAGTPGAAGETEPKVSTAPVQKEQTFTMLTESHPNWPYDKNALVWKIIKEKTGVSLNMQTPSGKLDDTINLNVASGNMPDITFMLSLNQANKYGQQGALANILEYTELMPNFQKWMEQYPDVVKSTLAADGNLYVFPNEGIGETNRMIWLYREDIFTKHNLQPPTTYDELYEVLKKLKEEYPDSYPFTFRTGNNLEILRNLSPAFLTNEGYYVDEATKEIKYGPVEDSYKTMIGYLNKFYKDGLMPKDWLTVDTKQWQDMISTNQSFITIDYISRIDFFNIAMRKENPEFNMQFMAPPAGPDGKALNAYTHTNYSGMTVSSNSKHIPEIMQYMDWFYSEEGKDILSWGIEGETYEVENGKRKIKSDFIDLTDLRKRTNLSTNGAYIWIDYDAHLAMSSEDLQQAYEEARKYDDVLRPLPSFSEQEQELISTKGEAVQKNRNETISKFILGERSLDEWDRYVEGAYKLGLEEVLATYRIAFERAANTKLN